jgi:DNA-binding NarL/FixJ family response regulator
MFAIKKESNGMGAKGIAKKSSVFLIDDHPVVREGFAHLINKQADFEVCGQAANAAEALSAIPEASPDLIVLDPALRGGNGFDSIKNLLALNQFSILILSGQDEMLYAERALRAGAKGYIMKHATVQEIMEAMRKAANGKRYLSPTMQEVLIDRLAGGGGNLERAGVERLSDREMEVFELIATGKNTREIAEHLKLSIKTVETYRAKIKEKLNLRNGVDLVRAAVAMVAERA